MEKAIANILKASKLKVTRPRLAVLELLKRVGRPVSIDEVMRRLKPKLDITTVYRVLATLVEQGIVYRTDFRSGKAYYELQARHHHHLSCVKCNKLEEIKVCPLPPASQSLSHTLEFFGLCKKCLS